MRLHTWRFIGVAEITTACVNQAVRGFGAVRAARGTGNTSSVARAVHAIHISRLYSTRPEPFVAPGSISARYTTSSSGAKDVFWWGLKYPRATARREVRDEDPCGRRSCIDS